MSRHGPDLDAGLEPVRRALLATARRDARATTAAAQAEADAIVAAATAQAAQIIASARRRGRAEAESAAAVAAATARRTAHERVLAAQAQAYQELRQRAGTAIAGLVDEPDYPELRARLAALVHRLLGPAAQVRDSAGGGVTGQAAGRRVDLSLTRFADRAVDVVAAREADG